MMIKKMFIAASLFLPLAIQPTPQYEEFKVTHIVEADGIYLESDNSNAYLTEKEYGNVFSIGDTVYISFTPEGEINELKGESFK